MKTNLVLAAVGLAGALASPALANITVSSKIDTEGGLLGNIIALALEDAGLPVERRLQLGGTQVVREALLAGQIDIYPEYTGNAAFFFNEADSDVWKNPEAAHARAAELDAAENQVIWLDAAPANNTWAIAVTGPVAEQNGLATMTDFGAWVAGGGDVKLAASTEFVSSPAVLPAMQKLLKASAGRLSIVYFTGPHPDTLVECLPSAKCKGEGETPKYAPITAYDHVLSKMNAATADARGESV